MFFAILLTSLFAIAEPATQIATKPCETCGGYGVVSCTNPKCDEGDVPCPKPCLKLSQGQWYLKDGLHWKKFTYAGGGHGEVSEHHLGQIVTLPKTKTGSPEIADCPTCNATTRVVCPTCAGTNLVTCPKCKGEGEVAAALTPR